MPIYSDYGVYTSPSSYVSLYLPYSNHSSILAANYRPFTKSLPRPFSRAYKPHLATIKESQIITPRRQYSPKISLHSTPKLQIPKPIKINTADIDVSLNKYRKFDRKSLSPKPVQDEVRRKSPSPIRHTENTQINNNEDMKTTPIRRDRALVRLHTVHRKEPFKKQEHTQEEEEPMKEEETLQQRKSPSFHDICTAISTDAISEDLNPGQPDDIQKRQSRQYSSDDFKAIRRDSAEILKENLVVLENMLASENLTGEPADFDARASVKRKKKLVKKKSDDKLTLQELTATPVNIQRRPTLKKIKRTTTDSSLSSDSTTEPEEATIRDISQVEVEEIKLKPKIKPIFTATVDVENKPNLKVIVDDVQVEEVATPKKQKKFKFNVTIEEIRENRKPPKNKLTDNDVGKVQIPQPKEFVLADVPKRKSSSQVGTILEHKGKTEKEQKETIVEKQKTDVETAIKTENNFATDKSKDLATDKGKVVSQSNKTQKATDKIEKDKTINDTVDKKKIAASLGTDVTVTNKTENTLVINKEKDFVSTDKVNNTTKDVIVKNITKDGLVAVKAKDAVSIDKVADKVKDADKMEAKINNKTKDVVTEKTKTILAKNEDVVSTDKVADKTKETVSDKPIAALATTTAKDDVPLNKANDKIKDTFTDKAKNILTTTLIDVAKDKTKEVSTDAEVIDKTKKVVKSEETVAISKPKNDKSEQAATSVPLTIKPKEEVSTTALKLNDLKTKNKLKDDKTNQTLNDLTKTKSAIEETEKPKNALVEKKSVPIKKSATCGDLIKKSNIKQISKQSNSAEGEAIFLNDTIKEINDAIEPQLPPKEENKSADFWAIIGKRESVYIPKAQKRIQLVDRTMGNQNEDSNNNIITETSVQQSSKENVESEDEILLRNKITSKNSLVKKSITNDPDLEVFVVPEPPTPEPEPEKDQNAFVPLQSNRLSQWMHPFKKPEQFDECPVEIFATPKAIRKRHYPKPRHAPIPPPQPPTKSDNDSDDNDDDNDDDEDEDSTTTESSDETSDEEVPGQVGASTSSNDSGFDSTNMAKHRNKG